MSAYQHPGTYIEEVPSGPSPIEGSSSNITGFVGVTRRGPTSGKPVLITSFGDFTRTFGGYWGEKDVAAPLRARWGADPDEGGHWWQFPMSVRGFFENGGARLYVKRVVPGGAIAARAEFRQGLKAQVQRIDGLRVTLDHSIGARAGMPLSFFDRFGDPIVAPGVTFAEVDAAGGSALLSAPVPGLGRGGHIQLHPHLRNAGLTVLAQSAGGWGNALKVRIRPMYGASLQLGAFPDGRAAWSGTVTAAVRIDGRDRWTLTLDEGGLVEGDRISARGRTYEVMSTAVDGGTHSIQIIDDGEWTENVRIALVRPAHQENTRILFVRGGDALYTGALVEIDNGQTRHIYRVDTVDGERVKVDRALPGDPNAAPLDPADNLPYYEGARLRVIEAGVDVRYESGDVSADQETFNNLRLVADDDDALSITTHLRKNSRYVTARIDGAIGTRIESFPDPTGGSAWSNLAGGDDNLASLSVDDFSGQDGGSGNRTGIISMEDASDVALVAAPGMWATSVQQALIGHASGLKDRFALLDTQVGLDIQGAQTARSTLSSAYAALYYPWLEVRDPLRGESVPLAPSGHLAGLFARVDVERGVHKPPANEVIRGITGIARDITDREQGVLNPMGINCLRTFPGRGHRVWGARTLAGDPAWKYINVRRLFIYVESSIEASTKWVVFEPNAEPLWARLRQSIGNFLGTLWRDGMLQGKNAEQAYFVRCDRSTMTQDDIDNGRLICQIGIAPVKPAEFVIFRFQQKTIDDQG